MRKLIMLLGLLLAISAVAAQDTTTANAVNIYYIACDTQGVVNFDGTMPAGYDVYYQLYSGANATGQALSTLRRVAVDGEYAVSESLAYSGGFTLDTGATGSVHVYVARESDSSSSTYDTIVNDVQDGCNSPQHSAVTSTGTEDTTTTAATGTIRSPFGGFLTTDVPKNPIVVIGVPAQPGRSNQPGVIFAECDQYPAADPGRLYDDDNIVIFWSWFAKTPEEVQDHIDNAIYNVRFMNAPLVPVQVSPIQELGSNYWVFYTVPVGNLSPGNYGVDFSLQWASQISDGYEKFGPDTLNDRFHSTCTFNIWSNPNRGDVQYNGMYSLPH